MGRWRPSYRCPHRSRSGRVSPRSGDPFRIHDASAPLITFVGAMDWEPNVDGVEYFCAEVWPASRPKCREARFRIVGRNPDRRVQKWACDSIEITGRVPSVVEHLHQSAVVIVPLRIGGGTRLKIYEAMATAKPSFLPPSALKGWMFITGATSCWLTIPLLCASCDHAPAGSRVARAL